MLQVEPLETVVDVRVQRVNIYLDETLFLRKSEVLCTSLLKSDYDFLIKVLTTYLSFIWSRQY
jgi:hypothetical protein